MVKYELQKTTETGKRSALQSIMDKHLSQQRYMVGNSI